MAVCRSLLIAVYHILLKREAFRERSEPTLSRDKMYSFAKVSDDLLIQELINRGYKLDAVT